MQSFPVNLASAAPAACVAASACAAFFVSVYAMSLGWILYDAVCPLSEPMRKQLATYKLWDAALCGDAAEVRKLLHSSEPRPDKRHPDTGADIVCDICAVRTADPAQDRRLSAVMCTLLRPRWPAAWETQQRCVAGMHHLMCQSADLCISRRFAVLLQAELSGYPNRGVLAGAGAPCNCSQVAQHRAKVLNYVETAMRRAAQQAGQASADPRAMAALQMLQHLLPA